MVGIKSTKNLKSLKKNVKKNSTKKGKIKLYIFPDIWITSGGAFFDFRPYFKFSLYFLTVTEFY